MKNVTSALGIEGIKDIFKRHQHRDFLDLDSSVGDSLALLGIVHGTGLARLLRDYSNAFGKKVTAGVRIYSLTESLFCVPLPSLGTWKYSPSFKSLLIVSHRIVLECPAIVAKYGMGV